MVNWVRKIWHAIKNEPLTVFFVLVLFFSLVWHENLRNKHFQECDSAGTYNMLYNFPQSALTYTALTYPEGHILSKERAEKILNIPAVNSLVQKYFAKYPKEQIIDRVSKLNILAIIRYGYIQAVSSIPLPHQLQGFFSVPLGSTYSAGPGLVYSLITGPNTSYESFMSRVLFTNILIFHFTVLLIYFICRKSKIANVWAIFSSLIFLFSISLYSSGYHTGSTLWNIFTVILLLWICVKFWDKPNFLKTLSKATAVLVFFNYLIIFLWVAILLTKFFQNLAPQNRLIQAWNLIKSQMLAVIFVGLCGVVFFQPGQSSRGSTSLSALPSDLYYTVLNFFSFYTQKQVLQKFQFVFGLSLIALAIYTIFKNKKTSENSHKTLKNILVWFLIIFCILVLLGILSLVPTRHILFLSPILILGLALGLNEWLTHTLFLKLGLILILLTTTAGIYSLKTRALDILDRTAKVTLTADLTQVGVYDCSYNLTFRNWQSPVPVKFINPKTFKPGQTYLYLSQTAPFSKAYKEWEQQYTLTVQIIESNEENSSAYFIAYNPDFQRLAYSRPNSLYETKFKIISIFPKQ